MGRRDVYSIGPLTIAIKPPSTRRPARRPSLRPFPNHSRHPRTGMNVELLNQYGLSPPTTLSLTPLPFTPAFSIHSDTRRSWQCRIQFPIAGGRRRHGRNYTDNALPRHHPTRRCNLKEPLTTSQQEATAKEFFPRPQTQVPPPFEHIPTAPMMRADGIVESPKQVLHFPPPRLLFTKALTQARVRAIARAPGRVRTNAL